jgi:molybdate transport system ATP-binding protein
LSARNVLPGTVTAVTPGDGPHARVEIACGDAGLVAEVTRLAVHELALAPGVPVMAIVKSVAFDEETIGVVEI